jgi:DNA-binding FadR family transcriptional regulator
MDDMAEDFPGYRQADVRFHIGLANSTKNPRLVAVATEAQGAMTDLISFIAHPPEILEHANAQHARLLTCIRARDADAAVRIMAEHLRGTEHVLAGLLPKGD